MLTDKEMAFHSEMRHLCDVAGGSLMVMASWWPLAVASAVSHGVEQSHDGQRKRNTWLSETGAALASGGGRIDRVLTLN